MNIDDAHLEKTLHREIPITQAMGIRVVRFDDQELVLGAPLAPNTNDKKTAFAGSLSTLIILSGWTALHGVLLLRDCPATIAVTDSRIRFLRPVTRDFEAQCALPSKTEADQLVKTLKDKGRARIDLEAFISEDGRNAVHCSATYGVIAGRT